MKTKKRKLAYLLTLTLAMTSLPIQLFAQTINDLPLPISATIDPQTTTPGAIEIKPTKYIGDGYEVEFKINGKEDEMYNAEIIIANTGKEALDSWTLKFDFNEDITHTKNFEIITHVRNTYIIRGNDNNLTIEPNDTIQLFFNIPYRDFVNDPSNFDLQSVNNQEKSLINNEFIVKNEKWVLENDEVIYGTLDFQGSILDLNGYQLIVKGDFIHSAGNLNFNKGTLKVEGDYRLQKRTESSDGTISYSLGYGYLKMFNDEDYMQVCGDFIMESYYQHSASMKAGTIEIMGNFLQKKGTISPAFYGSETHKVILSGTEKQTVEMQDNNCRFNILEIKNTSNEGVEFISEIQIKIFKPTLSKITFKQGVKGIKLEEDLIINDDFVSSGDLDLNGYQLIVKGDFINLSGSLNFNKGTLTVKGDFIHSAGNLNFNKGTLKVEGDYRLQKRTESSDGTISYSLGYGYLKMFNDEDYMQVCGDFIMESYYQHSASMKAGTIEIMGNFLQKKGTISPAFYGSETHKVILSGTEKQTVEMQDNNCRFNILITTKSLDSYTFLPATRKTFWLEHIYDPNAGRIIKDPIIGQPNVNVEFNPYNILDDGMMNLQIKVTNIGNVPIILDGMEIKYYYTNDNELEQKIYYQYAIKKDGNSSISLEDYLQVNTAEMEISKQLADTYVKTTFKSGAGRLNVDEYVFVNIVVYNDNYLNDTYILENDHSYLTNEISTFALNRTVNSTSNMVNASNIVVAASWLPWNWGNEPKDLEGHFASFKIGEGDSDVYKIDDVRAFQRGMIEFGLGAYPKYGLKHNVNNELEFTNDNLKAILESDIAYISGHGYHNGIIPIFRTGVTTIRDYGNYSQYLTADINTDVNTCAYEPDNIISKSNIFSLNMKDHIGKSIDLKLKWLIFGACSQLETSDVTGYDSVYKWVNVLRNNDTMHGILGYHKTAPTIGDKEIMDKFIDKLRDGKTFVEAWKGANGGTINFPFVNNANWGCLIKEGCDETLVETMSCQVDHSYNNFILYRYEQKDLVISSIQNSIATVEQAQNIIELQCTQEDQLAISIANAYLGKEKLNPISIINQKTERLNIDGEPIEILDNKYIINYAEIPSNNVVRSSNLSNPFSLLVDLNEGTAEFIQ